MDRGIEKYNKEQAQEKAPSITQQSRVDEPNVGSQLDPNSIKLILGHAYWYGYRGATENPPTNSYKEILPNEPMYIDFTPNTEKRFVFGVDNQNSGVPFEHVRLNLMLKKEDALEVRIPVGEKGEKWEEQVKHQHYWFPLGIINDQPIISWGILKIKFPRPGKYIFDLQAVGKGVRAIHTRATVIVGTAEPPLPDTRQPASGSYFRVPSGR